MKRYFFCITSTPTAYATIDTTIIHHVYKPDFSSLRSFYAPTGSWDLIAIKSAAVFGLVFFQISGYLGDGPVVVYTGGGGGVNGNVRGGNVLDLRG